MVVVLLALLAFAPLASAVDGPAPSVGKDGVPGRVTTTADEPVDTASPVRAMPAAPPGAAGEGSTGDGAVPMEARDSPAHSEDARGDDGRSKATWLGERSVSASRDDLPGVVHRLRREDLESAGDLATAIGRLPGVRIRRLGGAGAYAEVSLRGSPASQVEVFLDGVPLHGSAGAAVDLGALAIDGLERVEVRQGTATDGNGGARIDLVSRRSWSSAGIRAKGGSFGVLGGSAFAGTPGGKATAALWGERADNDYPFPWDRGTVYNTADDEIKRLANNGYRGLGASAAVRLAERQELSLRWESSRKEISSVNILAPDAYFDRASWQAAWSADWGDRLRLPARFVARRHESRWVDRSGIDYRSDVDSREDAWDVSGSLGTGWDGGGWWNPRARIQGRWESSDRRSVGRSKVMTTPSARRTSLAGEAGWSGASVGRGWGLDAALLSEILRDTRRDTPSGGSIFDAPAADSQAWRSSVRIRGAGWVRPARWIDEAWLSATYRERAPEFREILGDGGLSLPNHGLENEQAWLLEAGLRARPRCFRFEVVPFLSFYRKAIETLSLGGTPLQRSENSLDYDLAGVEVLFAAAPRWGRLDASATFQRSRLVDFNPYFDGNEIARTPRWKSFVILSTPEVSGLVASYALNAQGESWASERNDESSRRSWRALHGLRMIWRRGGAEIAASADNLTDEHYEDYEDFALSGRSFHLEASLKFSPHRKHHRQETIRTGEQENHEETP